MCDNSITEQKYFRRRVRANDYPLTTLLLLDARLTETQYGFVFGSVAIFIGTKQPVATSWFWPIQGVQNLAGFVSESVAVAV
jgi:hypothetical protein